MRVEASLFPIWPGFSVELSSELVFEPGQAYHLSGPNGSGKSSFLSQVLLPRLIANPACYRLYFEQQMNLQLYAVQAYAALLEPRRLLAGETGAVGYLLESLAASHAKNPRPAYILADESHALKQISEFLKERLPSACLIYCAHGDCLPDSRQIFFEPLSPQRSGVHASPA